MNSLDFIGLLNDQLSVLAKDERTVLVAHLPGLVHGPRNGSVSVNLINLPYARWKERRGGGAESQNNRMLFMVNGFGSDPQEKAEKVSVEQLVSSIMGCSDRLRKKTATPEKIASYLATFINQVVANFDPRFTHD